MKSSIRRGVAVLFVALITVGVFDRSGAATQAECWLDVVTTYPAGAGVSEVHSTPAQAVTARRVEVERGSAARARDIESIDADPTVAETRRALYARARPGTPATLGSSEWVWTEDAEVRGLIVVESTGEGWRVDEEHVRITDGPCR
jgi:hypothetical protein